MAGKLVIPGMQCHCKKGSGFETQGKLGYQLPCVSGSFGTDTTVTTNNSNDYKHLSGNMAEET